jgi:alpha-glucosidase
VEPLSRLARYVRPDEMHQAFNFSFLTAPWDAAKLRTVVNVSLDTMDAVGAPTTWVLSNHDVVRHASRFGLAEIGGKQLNGIAATDPQPDAELGLRRARAATLLMLGLPGSAYVYQGEELGLPDHTALPAEVRQDPSFFRTDGAEPGRDGCRVPLPWSGEAPPFGFTTGEPWLPQPPGWSGLTVETQAGDPASTLALYRAALAARPRGGGLAWRDSPPGTLVFERDGLLCLVNVSAPSLDLPEGELVLASEPGITAALPPDTAAWLRLPVPSLGRGRSARP